MESRLQNLPECRNLSQQEQGEIAEELSYADITTRVKDIAVGGHEPRKKAKKYDEVDLGSDVLV